MDTLYLAFELAAKKWKVAFATDARRIKVWEMEARNWAQLTHLIERAKKVFKLQDPRLVSCYEAGRDGFWLHRGLTRRGIQNQVLDSSSIEVNRHKRRCKTDRVDARALIRLLLRNQAGDKAYQEVAVPTVEQEDGRQLHRALQDLKRERTMHTNRIKGLACTQGVEAPATDKLFPHLLETLRGDDGQPLPPFIKARILDEYQRYLLCEEQIAKLEAQQREMVKRAESQQMEQIKFLAQLRGLGLTSSWILVMEYFGWRTFANRKQVGSAAGLAPTPYDSGLTRREQGISKAGNARIRWLMVELSWLWLRWQPDSDLSRWYRQRTDGAGTRVKRIAIVAMARKLLIAIWHFLKDGVVPSGAVLSPLK